MGIAENIKKLREAHHLSQAEFAKLLGVSDKAVSTWENGTRIPRMGVIQKMADLYGLQKTDIIEDKQPLTTKGEELLNESLIEKLRQLTPEEQAKVDAFVQGLLASR